MRQVRHQLQRQVQKNLGRAGQIPRGEGYASVGGSFAYRDTATGIAFALTKNRLTQDFSAVARLSRLVTEALS